MRLNSEIEKFHRHINILTTFFREIVSRVCFSCFLLSRHTYAVLKDSLSRLGALLVKKRPNVNVLQALSLSLSLSRSVSMAPIFDTYQKGEQMSLIDFCH